VNLIRSVGVDNCICVVIGRIVGEDGDFGENKFVEFWGIFWEFWEFCEFLELKKLLFC
jgi:hypothetical protein